MAGSYSAALYEVHFLSSKRVVIKGGPLVNNGADSKTTIYSMEKDGSVSSREIDEWSTMTFSVSGFDGWLALDRNPVWFDTSGTGRRDWYGDLKSITAWKF